MRFVAGVCFTSASCSADDLTSGAELGVLDAFFPWIIGLAWWAGAHPSGAPWPIHRRGADVWTEQPCKLHPLSALPRASSSEFLVLSVSLQDLLGVFGSSLQVGYFATW